MMTNRIRLEEHQERDVMLSLPELTAIRQLLARKLEVWPTGEPGRYRLKAGSHVGFVVMPGGRTLVIEPKVSSIETIFALLAAVYDPSQDFFHDAPQSYTTVEDLFEFVVRIFVTHVEDLIARGIVRGYRQLTDDLVAIRGRLLFSETLRHRAALRDRHWCAHTHFTADVDENRILRWTAFCLRGYRYHEPQLPARLRRVGLGLAEVVIDPEARRLFERLQFHRLNDPYRPALALARLVLDHLTFSGAAGGEPFLAYLVDMNWLFEKYLGAVLRRAAARWGLSLHEQREVKLDLHNRVPVKPDAVLYSYDHPLLALDAKYKLAADRSDLYQMLAYCHALDLPRGVLVHPATEAIPQATVLIRGAGQVCVHYLALDLRGDPQELACQSRALADQVEAILMLDESPSRADPGCR